MSIVMFVGRNGHGKTAALVQYGVLPCWYAGRRVVSNVSLYPEEVGHDVSLYQPLNEPLVELPRLGRHSRPICVRCRTQTRFATCRTCGEPSVEIPRAHPDGGLWSITENRGCGLVLDEIVTMFPARDSVSLPPELQRLLNQWRKPDIAPVLITCPDWRRADLMIRETVQAVVESRPYLPLAQRFLGVSHAPKGPWGWTSYGWFVRSWFDPESYELADQSVIAANQLQPIKVRRSLSRRARKSIRAAYDTSEGVELADHISCSVCGGKSQRGSCKSPDLHRLAARDARRQVLREYITPKMLQAAGLHDEADALDEELFELTDVGDAQAG